MKRRNAIVNIGGAETSLLAGIRSSRAAPTAKVGWLKVQGARHTPNQLRAFIDGMNALGEVAGRDYLLVERYAQEDEARLPKLAKELVDLDVSLIVATSQPSLRAAAGVTSAVPIIGRFNGDPVATGMAGSLGRPGGNISGVYSLSDELASKRLALLKDAVPSARRVGALLRDDAPKISVSWHDAAAAAQQLQIELIALNARSPAELLASLDRAAAEKLAGILTFRNPTLVSNLETIAEHCRKYRLASIFDAREFVDAGGLMSYGSNIDGIYRQLARLADKILKGAPVSTLPIEQTTRFEFIINIRTAAAIGVHIPPTMLARADEVIE